MGLLGVVRYSNTSSTFFVAPKREKRPMEAYRELFHEQLTEKPMKMLQKTYEGYDTEKG